MALPPPDWQRLADMQAYCRRALRHLSGRSRPDLDHDEQFQDALLRCLTVMGEAAYKLGPATQTAHPQIPRRRIAAFRHVLVHDYGGINLDRVWEVATGELARLDGRLSEILPESPPHDDPQH